MSSLAAALDWGKTLLNSRSSSTHSAHKPSHTFTTAPREELFPKVDPAVDGEDCDHDCASCEIRYPTIFLVDKKDDVYGMVPSYETHLLVATGKTNWTREVSDEKGSVMEAVEKSKIIPDNGNMMLSASNLPVPSHDHSLPASERPTTVLLLPAFTYIDNVTPASVPDLMNHCISTSKTITSRLNHEVRSETEPQKLDDTSSEDAPSAPLPVPISNFKTRPCPHKHLILMCSHRTRDTRCGQSAPLLQREFERHLRPLGLYRDMHDERPGGVGIYFVSHVGKHKYSANVLIYRKADGEGEGDGEASQCIWLARVRPEDCENIIKFTVLQGKVVKPASQLRGGFDRAKGLVSW